MVKQAGFLIRGLETSLVEKKLYEKTSFTSL